LDGVFTIVVTYNGMSWIRNCLESLVLSQAPSAIIVVDNNSVDPTVDFISTNYPGINLIRLQKNIGFGQANNIGIEYARKKGAEYFFLLNQDAWIEHNTIKSLHDSIKRNKNLGILSPLHVNGNGTDLDIYFRKYLQQSKLEDFFRSSLLKKKSPQGIIKTRFVNAAAWMISRECIEKTGTFDPVFHHYGEDENYAQRVLYNKFEIGIDLHSKIFHDREQRLLDSLNKADSPQKEWIQYLVNSCNINRSGYLVYICKQLMRYVFRAVTHFISLDLKMFRLDLYMIKRIPFSILKIRNSRKRSLLGNLNTPAFDIPAKPVYVRFMAQPVDSNSHINN
jgi:GT2 family glycosyltransferase